MIIKQDPMTKLWCREDGAVLMPPCKKFPKFRWTFGCKVPSGYCVVGYRGKYYFVHVLICRAYHGLPPEDKPEVDHINRIPWDNRQGNLRYADRSLNCTNRACVDKAVEKYGVRACEDKKAYGKVYGKIYYKAHHEKRKAYAKAYMKAKYAEKKAQGLHYCKGPNGRWGWYLRIRAQVAGGTV